MFAEVWCSKHHLSVQQVVKYNYFGKTTLEQVEMALADVFELHDGNMMTAAGTGLKAFVTAYIDDARMEDLMVKKTP